MQEQGQQVDGHECDEQDVYFLQSHKTVVGALLTAALIASGIKGLAQVISVAQGSGEDRNRDGYGCVQAL